MTNVQQSSRKENCSQGIRLKLADLDILTPARQRDNPYGGKVTFYKTDEVVALAERLHEDPSSSVSKSSPGDEEKERWINH